MENYTAKNGNKKQITGKARFYGVTGTERFFGVNGKDRLFITFVDSAELIHHDWNFGLWRERSIRDKHRSIRDKCRSIRDKHRSIRDKHQKFEINEKSVFGVRW